MHEGLAIVKGVRERHDGSPGAIPGTSSNAAATCRSMASWGVLTALSGYHFDLPHKTLGFGRAWVGGLASLLVRDQGWGTI